MGKAHHVVCLVIRPGLEAPGLVFIPTPSLWSMVLLQCCTPKLPSTTGSARSLTTWFLSAGPPLLHFLPQPVTAALSTFPAPQLDLFQRPVHLPVPPLAYLDPSPVHFVSIHPSWIPTHLPDLLLPSTGASSEPPHDCVSSPVAKDETRPGSVLTQVPT